MTDKNAFDRQLAREIENLSGPVPRVDVRTIVAEAARPAMRPRWAWLGGSLRLAAATAVIALFGAVLVLGFMRSGEQGVMLPPGASSSPLPLPSPSVGGSVPVSGTWVLPDPPTCETAMAPVDEPMMLSATTCHGLRVQADDPRLSGEGSTRQEVWADDLPTPEVWSLVNAGGTWTSQRYHDHDRFVFVGEGGYDGLTAVVTLAEDGSLHGFVRVGQPRGD